MMFEVFFDREHTIFYIFFYNCLTPKNHFSHSPSRSSFRGLNFRSMSIATNHDSLTRFVTFTYITSGERTIPQSSKNPNHLSFPEADFDLLPINL